MIRADEKLASALCQLHHNDDFAVVRDWLNNSFEHHKDGIIDLPAGELTEKGKGYCAALKDICERINEPRKLADKFRK